MAIRIEWDEFEIALLIEACEEVLHKGKSKSEVVKTVSSNLRKRAINKNIVIDDVSACRKRSLWAAFFSQMG